MDALLANYGSDDDEIGEVEEQKPQHQRGLTPHSEPQSSYGFPPPTRRSSLFGSLPPPKTSSGNELENPSSRTSDDARKTSLFSALPPPKSQKDTAAGIDYLIPEKKSSLFGSLPLPKDTGNNVDVDFNAGSLFGSLPPPRDAGNHKNAGSLFSSLPPPKDANAGGGTLFGSMPPPKVAKRDASASSLSGSQLPPKDTAKNVDHVVSDPGKATPVTKSEGKSALFSALPPPKNTAVDPAGKPPPGPGKSSSAKTATKRVVMLRSSLNMELLKDDEDDDDGPKVKRHANDSAHSGKATGLAAILPKPKYSVSGGTLGSGFGSGGHRTTLEIDNTVNNMHPASEMDGTPEVMVHDNSSYSTDTTINPGHYDGGDLQTGGSGSNAYNTVGSWETHGSNAAMDFEGNIDAAQWTTLSSSSEQYPYAESSGAYAAGEYHEMTDDQYYAMASEASTYTAPVDPLANILMKERRKGGRNMPPTIIEVKQAELTSKTVREDKLRTTGIAFGPAYKPTSNKAKPSKLLRRKHQIGTLLYDMRQKEMELLERRSKGNMSKAQTQAKYGW